MDDAAARKLVDDLEKFVVAICRREAGGVTGHKDRKDQADQKREALIELLKDMFS